MVRKIKTSKQVATERKLTEANNKLRWFCVVQPFKCALTTLKRGWYEKTGSSLKTHDIKLKGTKEHFTISDVDYKKIINTFEEANKHLKL